MVEPTQIEPNQLGLSSWPNQISKADMPGRCRGAHRRNRWWWHGGQQHKLVMVKLTTSSSGNQKRFRWSLAPQGRPVDRFNRPSDGEGMELLVAATVAVASRNLAWKHTSSSGDNGGRWPIGPSKGPWLVDSAMMVVMEVTALSTDGWNWRQMPAAEKWWRGCRWLFHQQEWLDSVVFNLSWQADHVSDHGNHGGGLGGEEWLRHMKIVNFQIPKSIHDGLITMNSLFFLWFTLYTK